MLYREIIAVCSEIDKLFYKPFQNFRLKHATIMHQKPKEITPYV